MAITQIIAPLPAVLNDSETFYEDIAIRNNSLVTVSFPSINTWSTQANTTQAEINAKAAQVAAQAVDGGYSQDYINSNFIGVNNAQDITEVKTFIASPIVPTPVTDTQAVNKQYADLKVALADFTGTNQDLSGNGYQKLPGGLILQWGIAPLPSNLANVGGGSIIGSFNFPIAFPTNCLSISLAPNQAVSTASEGLENSVIIQSVTHANCHVAAFRFAGSGAVGEILGVNFIAIGF